MFTLYIEDINGGQTHEHSFGEGELVIGRSREKCDIVLPSDNISRRHARLYTADNRCFIQDLQSSNGVFVDGVRIRDVREIEATSRVRIGDYVLYVGSDEVPQAAGPVEYGKLVGGAQAGGQTFTIREAVSLVGRGKDTAITVIDPSISRIHAKLTVTQSNDYVLQDLKSSNGTYVNDQRIDQTVLRNGDRIRFGNVEFRFEASGAAGEAPDRPTASPADIVASPAMPIPPAVARGPAGPAVPPPAAGSYRLGEQEAVEEEIPARGGGRWLVVGIVGLLVVAVAILVVVLMTRGPSGSPTVVPDETRAAAEKAAEEVERRERRERRKREEVEEELEQARALIQRRRWDQALISLQTVIDLDPTNEEVLKHRALIANEKPNAEHFAAAEAAAEHRDWAKALAEYEAIPERSVYRVDAQEAARAIRGKRAAILEEAEEAERSKDWELAAKRYHEALAIEKDDEETARRLKKLERYLD